MLACLTLVIDRSLLLCNIETTQMSGNAAWHLCRDWTDIAGDELAADEPATPVARQPLDASTASLISRSPSSPPLFVTSPFAQHSSRAHLDDEDETVSGGAS